MDFYIMQDLMKRGPFTLEELRQRGITPETLVQQNGSGVIPRCLSSSSVKGPLFMRSCII